MVSDVATVAKTVEEVPSTLDFTRILKLRASTLLVSMATRAGDQREVSEISTFVAEFVKIRMMRDKARMEAIRPKSNDIGFDAQADLLIIWMNRDRIFCKLR